MDAEDLRLFAESLRQAALRNKEQGLASFDEALEELGWRDALVDEPAAAAAALFAVQGELNVSSSALDDVVLTALGLAAHASTAVALPALGEHLPPGAFHGERLIVRGVGTRRLRDAGEVIVVAIRGEGHVVVRVPRADLDLRAVDGMDPWGGWVEVTGEIAAPGVVEATAAAWTAATVSAQVAVAQEITAASRSMLMLARDHAADRIQFGRPIGSFQAVRHRLADSFLAVESADAAVGVGWAEPSTFTAEMAKAIAGRTGRTVARHAQQVLAGMGFTSEHAFHRYFKRVLVLDQLFGSGASLSTEIGNEILATRRLPEPLAL
jgi:alkylation response protein AidB-like acyl-CoA dehydrogenase